jgi:DNA-binding LytR/AlgR family response regulator
VAARVREADRHQRRDLIVLGIGVRAEDGGETARRIRPIDVGIERMPCADRNGDVLVDPHPVLAA